MKIGYMLVFDEITKGAYRFESFELSEAFDGQNIRRTKFLILPDHFFVFLGKSLFVRYGISFVVGKVQKVKRRSVLPAFVAKHFARHVGRSLALADV